MARGFSLKEYSITKADKDYMQRAIMLALKGMGYVHPNPLVGAVIVRNGRIIGEGYHEKYGSYHAEKNAILNVTEDVTGADMYVTLEPCCHHGKQPPCADLIIDRGIKRVYIGSHDPNVLVNGGGIAKLRDAGVEVVEGLLEDKCDEINSIFFHYITTKTPYVTYKYAMSIDGKTACETGKSKWITGEDARQKVQEYRHEHTAIMAGINTVLADDPMLNCRMEGGEDPIRIICDTGLRIPVESKIVQSAGDIETIVLTAAQGDCSEKRTDTDAYNEKAYKLSDMGVSILQVPLDKAGLHIDILEALKLLGERGIDSLLLEGGPTLAASFFEAGAINEIRAFVGAKVLGGSGRYTPTRGYGIDSPDMSDEYIYKGISVFNKDIMLTYKKEIKK